MSDVKPRYPGLGRQLIPDACVAWHRSTEPTPPVLQVLRKLRHSKWGCGEIFAFLGPYLAVAAWSVAVKIMKHDGFQFNVSTDTLAIFTGLLSFLLVFRNNQAFARWYEGRRLWGAIAHECTSYTMHMSMFCEDTKLRQRALRYTVAFSYALKHQLRNEPMKQESYAGVLSQHDVDKFNATNGWMPLHAIEVMRCCGYKAVQQLPPHMAGTALSKLEASTSALSAIVADMIRVRNGSVPIVYAAFLMAFTWLYLLLLPCTLVDHGWMLVPVTCLAGILYLGLHFNAVSLEDPFGLDVSDLNLKLFCRTIEQQIFTFAYSGAGGGNDLSVDESPITETATPTAISSGRAPKWTTPPGRADKGAEGGGAAEEGIREVEPAQGSDSMRTPLLLPL